jgi:invasion protein IalB
MSRLRLLSAALTLAGTLGTDGEAIAKPQRSLGSVREGVASSSARPTFAQSATTTSAPQLPNGASSISETYGSWIVDCRLADGQKLCRLLQVQSDRQNNQRVLEISLLMPTDWKMEGAILMPFGVKLDSGAVIKLDDEDPGVGLRFFTCVPAGCLLPVSFPAVAVDAMMKATMLTVASLDLNDAVITFNVSLDGFAAALARVAELGRWKPPDSSTIRGTDRY